jgi:hypothetical protein
MGLGRKKLVLNPHSGRKENNMLSITKTTNLSGTSVINGQSAMTMYAAVPETGSLTISQTITNKELYLANQTQCDTDYENFKSEVNKLLKNEQQTVGSDTADTITE